MNASWPVAGNVEQPLLKSADYLTGCAHEFRVRIKAMMNPKGKKVNGLHHHSRKKQLTARILGRREIKNHP